MPAYTLVEMLVAVALVMLVMTLFVQVFQMAGGSLSTQRGMMENDQRARSVQTLLLGDLSKRTFRQAVPFTFNEDLDQPESNLSRRQGYLYISENQQEVDTDDVLAFTVHAGIVRESPDVLNFYGCSSSMVPGALSTTQRTLFYRLNLDQPETDDGRFDLNRSSDSPAAEVVYFVRGGNLYRRVLLIREQRNDPEDDQPEQELSPQGRFFSRSYMRPGGTLPVSPMQSTDRYPAGFVGMTNFWRDFDFSAHPTWYVDDANNPTAFYYDGAEFNGTLKSLQIKTPLPNMLPPVFAFLDEVAYPPNRFGFNTVNPVPLLNSVGVPVGGMPREWGEQAASQSSRRWWVGRPTMEETSHSSWSYPQLTHQVPTGFGDPLNLMNRNSFNWPDANRDQVIDGLNGGPRRGEDLVMSNVHGFDVKVWDELLNRFVDIGHDELQVPTLSWDESRGRFSMVLVDGDFHWRNCLNIRYGPASLNKGVFDTWYPFHQSGSSAQLIDFDGDVPNANANGGGWGQLDFEFNRDDGLLPDFGMNNNMDTNQNCTLLDHENSPPYRPRKYWASDTTASSCIITRPTLPRWTPDTSYIAGQKVFPGTEQAGDPFHYVCVKVQDLDGVTGTISASSEPLWPRLTA